MRVPRTPPTRAANTPAIIARKNSLPAPPKTDAAPARDRRKAEPEIIARADPTPPPPQPVPAPVPREIIPEQTVVAERPLPTVKELLPPIGWSSNSGSNAPVSLNTRDPNLHHLFHQDQTIDRIAVGIPGAGAALRVAGQACRGIYHRRPRPSGTLTSSPLFRFSTPRRGGIASDQSGRAVSADPILDKTEPVADLGGNGVPRQSLKLPFHAVTARRPPAQKLPFGE